MHSNLFPYPIGLLLFNRPEYSIQLLRSLAEQTMKPSEIYVHIDGYKNSRDELAGRPDFQNLTISYLNQKFPNAHVVVEKQNQGIARSWHALEEMVFKNSHSRFAQFFEADMLLSKHYLQSAFKLITEVGQKPSIGTISLTGESNKVANHKNILTTTWGTKAVAVKREHYMERMEFMWEYLGLFEGISYWQRDSKMILEHFHSMGIYLPGTCQDQFKAAMLAHFNKMQLNTTNSYVRNLGRFGHSRIISKNLDDITNLDLDTDFAQPLTSSLSGLDFDRLLKKYRNGYYYSIYEIHHLLPKHLSLNSKIKIIIKNRVRKFKVILKLFNRIRNS